MSLLRNTIVVLFVFVTMAGCIISDKSSYSMPKKDLSVEYIDNINGHTNGIAYDFAEIDGNGIKTVVVPFGTEVNKSSNTSGKIRLILKKKVSIRSIASSPSNRVSVDDVRKDIGCCYCVDSGVMTIVCFGNSIETGEGCIQTTIEIQCPEVINVVERQKESRDITTFGQPTPSRTFLNDK